MESYNRRQVTSFLIEVDIQNIEKHTRAKNSKLSKLFQPYFDPKDTEYDEMIVDL